MSEEEKKREKEKSRQSFFNEQIKNYKGPLARTYEVITHSVREEVPRSLLKINYQEKFTDEALQMYNYALGLRVCILNFANADTVGGGVTIGKKAQEEDLMLLSPMLYNSIAKAKRADGTRIAERVSIHGSVEKYKYTNWGQNHWNRYFLVSDDVVFNRVSDVPAEVTPYTGTVITAAAPNHRGQQNIEIALADKPRIKQVIRNILEVAADRRYEVLVLGAWGCGAFAPVDKTRYRIMMAEAFGEVFATSPHTFRNICFPIRDPDMRNIFEITITRILSNPSMLVPSRFPILHCKARGCIEKHSTHHCKICGNNDSNHRSADCPRK